MIAEERGHEFNVEMLALARARERLTQSALAARSGLNQGIVSKIELGIRPPTQGEWKTLAVALGVPIEFFARHSSDRFVATPPLFRLQRKRVAKTAIDQLNAEMVTRAMHLREMLRSVELDAALPVPATPEVTTPEEMAQRVRTAWLVREGPFPNLTALIEAAGIYIVELSSDVDAFEGCAFRAPNLPTIIFVKEGQPTDRRRFTLAHELGHLLLHEQVTSDVESEANLFAQALLMPAADARREIGRRPNLDQLRRIKREWKISMSSAIMIASRLDLISPAQKARLYQQLSIMGWRTMEPDALPPEQPKLFALVLRTLLVDLGYSVSELARVVCEYADRVERMYELGVSRPTGTTTLKVV